MLEFTFIIILFTFERKCLKIIAFFKRYGFKMNGSSIGLGNNVTVATCNYSSKIVNTEEAALTSYMKGKKQVKKSPSDQCMKLLMLLAPAPPLFILKISLSGVWSSQ